jgi:osmotically-inducible protein OsmY
MRLLHVKWVWILLFLGAGLPWVTGKATAVSDPEIQCAVSEELSSDRAIRSEGIRVEAEKGIVILSGSVESAFSRKRAVQISERIRGVRSVVNRLEVVLDELRSDYEIQQGIRASLLVNPATESYEVDVKVEGGRVTLFGTVDSWQEKSLAGCVARAVKGVREVSNHIEVRPQGKRADAEIRREIVQRLHWDVRVEGELLEVFVSDGRVELIGVVDSAAEKRRAVREARVAGVQSVDASGLKVEDWAGNDDLRKRRPRNSTEGDIRAAVMDALAYDPRVIRFHGEVQAGKGVVTLQGSVGSLQAKRAIEQDASNTVGVREVVNRLQVEPREILPDPAVAKRVRKALKRHVCLEGEEIQVECTQGVVQLTGNVDTDLEKSQAEDVASQVRGVVSVKNHLGVRRNSRG